MFWNVAGLGVKDMKVWEYLEKLVFFLIDGNVGR